MHHPTFRGRERALLVAILSLTALSAGGAQAAPGSSSQAAAATNFQAPAVPAIALVAPDLAPAAALPVAGSATGASTSGASGVAATAPARPRAAGLTTRDQRANSELPLPAPRQENSGTRTNTALMIVGAAAIVLGAAVGDEAGTVLIIGGAGVGLYGLYRLLN